MALNRVTLTGTYLAGDGTPLTGYLKFLPNTELTDATDTEIVRQAPITATLTTQGTFSVQLYATDNTHLLPSGWVWNCTEVIVGIAPNAYSFALAAAPFSFTATNATPCVFTATGSAYSNGAAVVLSGGSLPAGFTAGTTYYVVSASGTTFSLAATLGGSAIASTSTGSGTVATALLDISTLQTITDAPQTSTYVPTANVGQPSGVAGLNSSGFVPIAQGGTGAGTAATGFTALAAGTLTTLGDVPYVNSTPAVARLAGNTTAQTKVLTQTGNGTISAAPAWGVVSGQYLCTPTQYAPGTQASLTTTSATFAAVSSANVNTGSFVAPPSGSVVVTAGFSAQVSAADAVAFGLAAHGTVTPMVGKTPAFSLAATSLNLRQSLQFQVTGLTAGTSYNLDLMFAIAAAGTLTVNAIGQSTTTPVFTGTSQGLPVTMTVQAI